MARGLNNDVLLYLKCNSTLAMCEGCIHLDIVFLFFFIKNPDGNQNVVRLRVHCTKEICTCNSLLVPTKIILLCLPTFVFNTQLKIPMNCVSFVG